MGFWLFLAVFFSGRMLLKAYKYYSINQSQYINKKDLLILQERIENLEKALAEQKWEKRLSALEENVFLGDFELNRQFSHLKNEMKAS